MQLINVVERASPDDGDEEDFVWFRFVIDLSACLNTIIIEFAHLIRHLINSTLCLQSGRMHRSRHWTPSKNLVKAPYHSELKPSSS